MKSRCRSDLCLISTKFWVMNLQQNLNRDREGCSFSKTHLLFDCMKGNPRLVKSLSETYSPLFGRNIDMNEEILCTVGAYGALFCAIQGLVNAGDEVRVFGHVPSLRKKLTLVTSDCIRAGKVTKAFAKMKKA